MSPGVSRRGRAYTSRGQQECEGIRVRGVSSGQGREEESQMAKPSLTTGWKPRGQPWQVQLERVLDTELRDWTSIRWGVVSGGDMVRAVFDHDQEVMGYTESSSLE